MDPPPPRLGSIEEHLGAQAVRSQVARPGQREMVPPGIGRPRTAQEVPLSHARCGVATGRSQHGFTRASPLWSSFGLLRGDPSTGPSERLSFPAPAFVTTAGARSAARVGRLPTRDSSVRHQRLESFLSASAPPPTTTTTTPKPTPLMCMIPCTQGCQRALPRLDLCWRGIPRRSTAQPRPRNCARAAS